MNRDLMLDVIILLIEQNKYDLEIAKREVASVKINDWYKTRMTELNFLKYKIIQPLQEED